MMADNNGNMLEKDYGTANTTYSTHWIVVAANQDSNKDAYKFKGLVANVKCIPGTPGCRPPGGGGGEAPIPGTLALLGIGAIAVRRQLRRKG